MDLWTVEIDYNRGRKWISPNTFNESPLWSSLDTDIVIDEFRFRFPGGKLVMRGMMDYNFNVEALFLIPSMKRKVVAIRCYGKIKNSKSVILCSIVKSALNVELVEEGKEYYGGKTYGWRGGNYNLDTEVYLINDNGVKRDLLEEVCLSQ